ncbi:H-NS family nucleoid-associated regulatory protein [Cupriavidus sp. BIS7]|uniref:H-NS family nucleoid-associated regulatory protein n=1 Tax=Cupriavidus sp. BIS7 TaxID=1217718 RepID=UPI000316896B|nr:H-NS family nucleoid-associated regulatory protein [Cupriavidus sp. BIS7]
MSEFDAAKQAAVAWVREQMDLHGLTFEDLVEAGCFAMDHADAADAADHGDHAGTNGAGPATMPPAAEAAPRVLYRNALGQTWDGSGEYPDWLQRAVNAGQSIDFYRVD